METEQLEKFPMWTKPMSSLQNDNTFLGCVFHFRLDEHEHVPQDDSFDIFTSSLIVIDWIH